MWLAIFVFASGFSSSTVGIWAHQSDLWQKVGHNYGTVLASFRSPRMDYLQVEGLDHNKNMSWERSRGKEKPEINTIYKGTFQRGAVWTLRDGVQAPLSSIQHPLGRSRYKGKSRNS